MASSKRTKKIDREALRHVCQAFLLAIGENPDRPGLKDTPRRFADHWADFIEYQPGNVATTFDSIRSDQMVVVSGMRVHSFCEHHILPFWCEIAIGYIADQKVLGLSKFARIAHKHAHQLQVQERLVEQIANEVKEAVRCEDVAVIGRGEHSCMVARGIKTPALMTSSVLFGRFKHDAAMRSEFLSIAGF